MIGVLASVGIAGLAVSLASGLVGALMALRPWPAYAARCRKEGVTPGFIWSSSYLDRIEPESRRVMARRGILLHGLGLAGTLIFFPFVLLSGVAF